MIVSILSLSINAVNTIPVSFCTVFDCINILLHIVFVFDCIDILHCLCLSMQSALSLYPSALSLIISIYYTLSLIASIYYALFLIVSIYYTLSLIVSIYYTLSLMVSIYYTQSLMV